MALRGAWNHLGVFEWMEQNIRMLMTNQPSHSAMFIRVAVALRSIGVAIRSPRPLARSADNSAFFLGVNQNTPKSIQPFISTPLARYCKPTCASRLLRC